MLCLGSAISEIYLSTKERNALELLGVSTVGDFMQLELEHVFDLRGFGAYTYAKLERSQFRLRGTLCPDDRGGNGACHLGDAGDDDIDTLGLSVRGRKALRRLKVRTVRGFLSLDLASIGHISNCGVTTWEELMKAQAELRRRSDIEFSEVVNDLIGDLGLTVRGLKTLQRLKVKTVREFLLLDLASIEHIPKCGVGTKEHLMKVQKELRRRSGVGLFKVVDDPIAVGDRFQQDETIREVVKQPAAPIHWRKLPLFSGHLNPGVDPADLHESYHPDTPIERLAMSGRVRRAVAGKGITSLGQLLLTPGGKLIGQNRLGYGTLTKTRSLVDEFLNHSMKCLPRKEVDLRTPDGFLLSLVQPVIGKERERRVLLERMGWRSEPRTLDELAQEFGLTRERIRQIEQVALTKLYHWRSTEALKSLHDLISGILKDRTPFISMRVSWASES